MHNTGKRLLSPGSVLLRGCFVLFQPASQQIPFSRKIVGYPRGNETLWYVKNNNTCCFVASNLQLASLLLQFFTMRVTVKTHNGVTVDIDVPDANITVKTFKTKVSSAGPKLLHRTMSIFRPHCLGLAERPF